MPSDTAGHFYAVARNIKADGGSATILVFHVCISLYRIEKFIDL